MASDKSYQTIRRPFDVCDIDHIARNHDHDVIILRGSMLVNA